MKRVSRTEDVVAEPLYARYRPATLKEVVGQDAAVRSLRGLIERGESRAFLFTGPSGTGKTTLARIAADMLGCNAMGVLELDAATHTGIDAMREVQDVIRYRPLGGAPARAVVIDEAHSISRQAWQSLLKVIEEPPPGVSWFFCTTEPSKVPQTIKTRCSSIALKLVPPAALEKLLDRVCSAEAVELASGVGGIVVREAAGSPRQLLVNLSMCRDARDRKEAAEILRTVVESDPIRKLCQLMVKGGSWTKAVAVLKDLEGTAPESARIAVCNYMAAALMGSKSDRDACFFLSILEEFAEPYQASNHLAPLILSVGRVMFADQEE